MSFFGDQLEEDQKDYLKKYWPDVEERAKVKAILARKAKEKEGMYIL